jgi:hypothetical protein
MSGFFAKYVTVQHNGRSYTYRRHPVLRYFAILLGIGVLFGALTALGPFGAVIGIVVVAVVIGSRLRSKDGRRTPD